MTTFTSRNAQKPAPSASTGISSAPPLNAGEDFPPSAPLTGIWGRQGGGIAARWLALGAVAGQLLFTLAWFVLGFVSPGFTIFGTLIQPYSPITTPLSGLGLGVTAPFMNTAFILGGLLSLVGAVGIFRSIRGLGAGTRWSCTALFGLSALGLMIDGVFTLEHFMPHMLGFLLGSGAPVVGFVVAGLALRRLPGWRTFGNWLLVAGPLTLVLLVISLATFSQAAIMAGVGIAGLTERILCVELSGWWVALGWLAFSRG